MPDRQTGFVKLTDLLRERSRDKKTVRFVSEISTGRSFTYGDFFELVQERARSMKMFGLKTGDKVGLIYKNSIEFMAGFFAVLENDAVVIPVNGALKEREMAYVFQDSDLKYVLTEPGAGSVDRAGCVVRECMLSENVRFAQIGNQQGTAEDGGDLEEGTAIILYTSGSTGKAKGVMLTHENLMCEMDNIIKAHKLTEQDRVLCVLPWFHINGLVITMLTPLLAGHEMIVAEKFSQSRFWNWIDAYQITWFSGVPTIYTYLLAGTDRNLHKTLRFARSASSSLPVKVLEAFEERYQVPVIESYGMTEGGSQLTSNPLPPEVRKPGSVGLPYGLEMRIVNENGEICLEGEEGEVQFCGGSITGGYYRKRQETKDAFDGKWLKTGDVGYADGDGYLFLSGRKKELINRSGEKFSPREIEEILYQCKGIKMAAAIGVSDEINGEEAVAFCVLAEGACIGEKEILEFCRKSLVEYKIPREILFVDELPVGGNGKVQRLKLKDVYNARRVK